MIIYVCSNIGCIVIPIDLDESGGDIDTISALNENFNAIGNLTNMYYNTYYGEQDQYYCLDSIHFHWGINSSFGSEHTFDDIPSPLEVHFVHYSCDYNDISDALTSYVNGETKNNEHVLAVVGILFDVGEENEALNNIINENIINKIKYHDDIYVQNEITYIYSKFNISDLVPGYGNDTINDTEFISYKGSLTTPPCYETVLWHVMKNKLTVSESQLNQFRKLFTGDINSESMSDNWRPIQPMNNRTLFTCDNQINEISFDKNQKNYYSGKYIKMERITMIILGVIFLIAIILLIVIFLKFVCSCTTKEPPLGANIMSLRYIGYQGSPSDTFQDYY